MDPGESVRGVPFGAGSVSFRSYPHDDLDAVAKIAELRAQAVLAVEHGFDGVMTSEHHAGFAGYMPNPLQVAGFLLDAMPRGWAAPCPLLLTLRPTALVAEEAAWLAARHPERLGIGVAAGALAVDFEVMGLDMHELGARFARALEELAVTLRGEATGPLTADVAIARCVTDPIPLLSAASSATAARRAARVGSGLLFDSLATPDRCRMLTDAYREAGGFGSVVLIRRAWLGARPDTEVARQVGVYRSYASERASVHWGADEMVSDRDASAVAERLVDVMRASGADALNLRCHVPGVSVGAAREQITALGDAVLPRVRTSLDA
ncbi:MAG TPA: LLM class flavin-dependent oxidoreductase [Acidimicrobiia bacterium]|jgi:alkanesulfonate monooxygenase SsuD/methylene tetrahydromethanopterin reductase-like flavin-dependent oxidoreductase (luciferase family)